jgi:hypothetical protein
MACVEICDARYAPKMAPIVVAISRNMPMRIFEKPSRTNADAAPLDVAMTDTSDAPIA